MANLNKPRGLAPSGTLNGSPWQQSVHQYFIASTDTNAFAIGDPVVMTGSGDGNGVPGITLATAGSGNVVLGAIVGYGGTIYGGASVDPNAPYTTIIPATKSKGYYVLVVDSPFTIYDIQESTTSATPLTAASIGTNANLLSGTNNGYISGWQFNNNTTGTGATLQLQLLGLVQESGNAFGAYAKWRVRINNHQFLAGVAGV